MKRQSNLLKLLFIIVALFSFSAMYAQQMTVSGTVTDAADGMPLPGVTVAVKGTTLGTITTPDGQYSLNVENGQTLVFSFIGYKSQEIIVANTSINVGLEEDVIGMEEVVVIGYGTVKKEDATGSVTAISTKDFNKGAITSPQELLVGKTPGVQITTAGGEPGAGATIRIRGGSSLSASNDPLIVIDGVPVDNSIAGMRNPLSTVNPNDIETFTVLKDASATAIYGSRASNGVIIITTKTGKEGAPLRISYAGNMSVSTKANSIDVYGAQEYANLIRAYYGESSDAAAALGYKGEIYNTDWQDLIYKTAVSQDHNLGFTGNAGGHPFRASVGFTDQNGILDGDNMKRFTGSVGFSPSFFDKHLKVNLNAKGMMLDNSFANKGAIGTAVYFDPTKPVRVDDAAYDQFGGYYTWLANDGTRMTLAPSNPIAQLEQQTDENTVNRFIGNAQFDYKFHFLPQLRANLNVGIDYADTNGEVNTDKQAAWTHSTFNDMPVSGFYRDYSEQKTNKLLDFYMEYARTMGEHDFKLMGGYSWQHFHTEGFTHEMNFFDDGEQNITKDKTKDGRYASEYYLVSFFGRLNYTFNNKYLFTATLRNDGSSRFHEDNRWGLFPSLAFAWKLSEESFLEGSSVLSDLKLRLGYGITGQQDIGSNYPYMPRYTIGDERSQYMFGNQYYTTLRPEGYDAEIKWEETTTYNIGFDYGFLNGRIFGTFDFYHRVTDDLLNFIPVPAGTNLTNGIFTNVGSLENTGFEFAINAKPISKENFMWDVGFNVTLNNNEITKLNNNEDPNYKGVETGGIAGGVGNTIQRHAVGQPVSSFFVYEQVYDDNGKPIEGLYVDRNKDGVIDIDDMYYYKDPAADVFMGINSRVEYKDWDFSFAGRINLGNYVYNNVNSERARYNNLFVNPGFLNNSNTELSSSRFTEAQYYSDYHVKNASFFRMDNISLGYTFNGLLKDNSSLRVSFTAQNVFVITKYDGLDPEVSGGIDNDLYPRPRIFMIGANFNF